MVPRRSVRLRLAALVLGIAVVTGAGLVAEGLVRLFGPRENYFRYDPHTQWSLRPGYRGPGPNLPDVPLSYDLRVNDAGFRGGPLELNKPRGAVRLAALGDSVTFGFGVAEGETFHARVVAALFLDITPRRIEGINGGVPGFTSFQGPGATSLVRRLGLGARPDARAMLPRVSLSEFEANLLRIGDAVRRAGAIPAFITPPAAFGPDRPPEAYFRHGWMVPRAELEPTRLRYAEAVRRAATTASILLVDCARLVPTDPRLFLADGYHPNEAGHRVMAEHIVEVLRQAGTLTVLTAGDQFR